MLREPSCCLGGPEIYSPESLSGPDEARAWQLKRALLTSTWAIQVSKRTMPKLLSLSGRSAAPSSSCQRVVLGIVEVDEDKIR